MSDEVPLDRQVTLRMLAEELDVPLATIQRWSDADRRNGFPEPVRRHGSGTGGGRKIYDRDAVLKWHEEYRRFR